MPSSPIIHRSTTIDLDKDDIETAIKDYLSKRHPDAFFQDMTFRFTWKDNRVYIAAEVDPPPTTPSV
jgi:hypothetical protein